MIDALITRREVDGGGCPPPPLPAVQDLLTLTHARRPETHRTSLKPDLNSTPPRAVDRHLAVR